MWDKITEELMPHHLMAAVETRPERAEEVLHEMLDGGMIGGWDEQSVVPAQMLDNRLADMQNQTNQMGWGTGTALTTTSLGLMGGAPRG